MTRLFRMILLLLLIVSIPGLFFLWLMPTEFFQSWMIKRAAPDQFSQFAAHEQATAILVFLRILISILSLLTLFCFYYYSSLIQFTSRCWGIVAEQTTIRKQGHSQSKRTILFRFLLLAWFSLGIVHFAGGAWRRIEDWPWYHFNSGATILPNMSDSNRDVIRFLKETTDEDARILVLSDQKLFFLSYYLLPRKLFHPIHPESEFVIPKEHQQRQLKAYRLSDLDAEYISKLNPDYILEYYEGADYLENDRFREDPRWLQFLQKKYGYGHQPTYNVRLHQITPSTTFSFPPKPEQVVVP
ncbi:hypothetical protein [Gimesia aquarii]|uniref:Uncharacterized protein n=1 Tax=Gimesia aquarii TaxID=2527964 RepID=A0A517VXJ9_9PLAN|nr:hypothetical protein [Gimesia aquarii]QDT97727.1 hypothetical protein V144x_32080 [Gimesia aquarii]